MKGQALCTYAYTHTHLDDAWRTHLIFQLGIACRLFRFSLILLVFLFRAFCFCKSKPLQNERPWNSIPPNVNNLKSKGCRLFKNLGKCASSIRAEKQGRDWTQSQEVNLPLTGRCTACQGVRTKEKLATPPSARRAFIYLWAALKFG